MARPRPSRFARLIVAMCLLVLALGVAACGSSNTGSHSAGGQASGENIADANNNGGEINAGPVTYQLQISRELNPYSTEDAQYLKGLPTGAGTLAADQTWYAVFLWAKNATEQPQTTTDNFVLTDSVGNRYYPVRLDASINDFAWTSQTLKPGDVQPGPGTVANDGPTQGELLLFKVNTSVYSNRPLTLNILGSDNQSLGTISLDL